MDIREIDGSPLYKHCVPAVMMWRRESNVILVGEDVLGEVTCCQSNPMGMNTDDVSSRLVLTHEIVSGCAVAVAVCPPATDFCGTLPDDLRKVTALFLLVRQGFVTERTENWPAP
jgi:hypothetical protein